MCCGLSVIKYADDALDVTGKLPFAWNDIAPVIGTDPAARISQNPRGIYCRSHPTDAATHSFHAQTSKPKGKVHFLIKS
jgi:hypothetical protein